MSDQLIFSNYLLLLKSTVEVYVHGTLESSNEKIRDLLKNCLDTIMDSQANTYDEMTSMGYYNIPNVSIKEVDKVLKNLTSK